MKKALILAAVVAAPAAAACAGTIGFNVIANIDLSPLSFATVGGLPNPSLIGTNPSAVAWNGIDAYVGGYHALPSAGPIAISRVSNVLSGPTFGPAFGTLTTPAGGNRGVNGLAWQGNNLAVGVDLGAGSGDSVRLFDTVGGGLVWRIGSPPASDTTRRGNGVAFDPGFNDVGPDQVAYLSIGSGRRHRLDTVTGAYINGQNAGAIINFSPVATTWRDLAFDPATGDLYTRESNRVGRSIRTGDNTHATQTVFAALTPATGVDNQNITFISDWFGRFVIVNDRSSTSPGQPILSNIKLFDMAGVQHTILLSGLPVSLTGNGAYDFAFDPVTDTLAVTDFFNRRLYIVLIPEPAALGLLGAAVPLLLRRRKA